VIDLHCHLHFGIDDGPKIPAESIELARALVAAGVNEVACTPHIRSDKGWLATREVQPELASHLDAALRAAGVSGLKIHGGAEHYLDDTLFQEPMEGRVVPYGQGRYLLVELPYAGPPPDLFGLLFSIRKRGYRILLAHLERYPYVVDDDAQVQRILDAGYLIQVNLGSLSGAYARAHKKAAQRLVKEGAASVAGGDCHRADDVKKNVVKGLDALRKLVGDEGVERLTVQNPRMILDDVPPEKIWS